MQSFSVAGYWANAQVTAADMARFMWSLDDVFAGPHREFALGLLGSVVASQRWGIPAGAGEGWNVRFKGGWRPSDSGALVHQAAELTPRRRAPRGRRAERRAADRTSTGPRPCAGSPTGSSAA